MKRLAAVGLLALVVVGSFLAGQSSERRSGKPATAEGVLPREYAYLDTGRVTNYLSQITNGLTTQEQHTLSRARDLSANAGANESTKIGVSQTDTAAVQETITPTVTSQFALLLSRLSATGRDRANRGPSWLTELSCFPRRGAVFAWDRLRRMGEGAFVKLKNCLVTYPDYGRVYPYLRSPPTLPLRLTIGRGKSSVKLLLPLSIQSVTDPGLFVGHSVIVGKLLQIVTENSFKDAANLARFQQSIALLGNKLYTIAFPGASGRPKGKKPQRFLSDQVRTALILKPRGAIVLPIAIYK